MLKMANLNRPFSLAPEGIRLLVHLQPGAKADRIAGQHGDAVKITLSAPPVDGKANAAAVKFIAKELGIPARQVTLVSGQTSRDKKFLIASNTPESIISKLENWIK